MQNRPDVYKLREHVPRYKGYAGHISKCDVVRECVNNTCMFRLRDVFGHPVFCAPGYEPARLLAQKACDDAGIQEGEEVGWPCMIGTPGTNVVYLTCLEYKEPSDGKIIEDKTFKDKFSQTIKKENS